MGELEKMGIRLFENLSRRHGLLPQAEPAKLHFH
jgi:hypothetical protein